MDIFYRGHNSVPFSFFPSPHNAGHFNPIALRKAKIVFNFGLSECNRVKGKKSALLGANSFLQE